MILNQDYQKHADWHEENKPWDFGGYMTAVLRNITIRVDIPAPCTQMTATVTDWDFGRLPPSQKGDGFVDYLGFAWWDPRLHTEFEDAWFVDAGRTQWNGSMYIEPSSNVFSQINAITGAQGSTFYPNTFYYEWQGNEGTGRTGNSGSPIGRSHTWPLTDEDFDESGALKNHPVFYVYNRHFDWGDGSMYPNCRPKPEHAHWRITDWYWFSDGVWNWKYHPMAIRKGSNWYSCNRLNSDVGHGDGHLGIRKGNRWNGVWNDDYDILSNEAHYDAKPYGEAGDYVYLPRVGLGADAVRLKDDIHEWEP